LVTIRAPAAAATPAAAVADGEEGAMTRTIEAMVDEQARRWEVLRRERADEERRPVVTVARMHGARGDELARAVADALGFELYDRELLHRVAESAHLSERVVSALDEKDRELLTSWLSGFASRTYLTLVEYRYHLAQVIGAIAHQGGAVIVGRGAHLILGEGKALRVLAVAPLEARVRNVMADEGLSEREARRRIVEVEADRRAFLMKQFHAEFADPTGFDVVVNTAALGLESAASLVREAVGLREVRARAAAIA
jgi:cytidylate kinase